MIDSRKLDNSIVDFGLEWLADQSKSQRYDDEHIYLVRGKAELMKQLDWI